MRTIYLLPVLLTLVCGVIAAKPAKEDAAKKDRDGIQGAWKVVAMGADGEQAPAEIVAALKLVFKDDTLTFTPGEPGFTNYTFKLDPTTKPASFNMIHAEAANKGEVQKGIYLLEGEHLKICFGNGDKRPKTFTAKAESGQAMYTLERMKP
jgi:uncharacterized protein (TIGR03067 family)